MFARVGSFAVRFRWPIIAAWILVAIVLTLVAPNIDDVSVTDQRAFLPSSAPSLDASAVLEKHFPDQVSPASAVVVVDAGPGNHVGQGAAAEFAAGLTAWLTGPDRPAGVAQVWTPTYGDEQTKANLISPNKQVALLLARFTAIGTEQSTKDAIAALEQRLQQAPAGVAAHLTGDGPILAAYSEDSKESMDSTTWITIVLVVVILLLIYRSPVSPIIPLLTIGLAYLISRAVVAFLGSGPLTISMYTNVFLIVVLFGAGTDYCLFLISRFREEMADVRPSPRQLEPAAAPAVRTTVRTIGETIASSAGTVIVGLAMMAAAELGLYKTTGPSIAIGVAIALIAGLTFTPALLTVLGHYAFWPRKPKRIGERGVWHAWAGKVVNRPILALVLPLIVLVPLAVYSAGLDRDFDLLGDLPKDDQTRQGFDVLAEHFGPGQMQPLNVVALDDSRFDTPQGLEDLKRLQAEIEAVTHVSLVRSFTGSLGSETLGVAGQIGVQTQAIRDGIGRIQDSIGGGGAADPGLLEEAAAGLTGVYGYLAQLAQGFPDVAGDAGYREAVGALGRLAALASSLGNGGGASDQMALAQQALTELNALADGLEVLQQTFAARPDAIMLPKLYLSQNDGLTALRDAYISKDGTATRLQVLLDAGPYSPEAGEATKALRSSLSSAGFQAVVEGDSAILLDIQEASDRDMTRALIYVLGGIFVVLVLLLRAIVSPIYLILTILLSYSATMGVVRLLFVDLLGNPGIVWWVPMFMFVMLVALGMDYNIFLIGRVKEEVASAGTKIGTRHALARTGGIITSAGIIMAGTFASMMSGSLLGLLQIGFAVAFGVLLDTFVVRTTLVPAITVLLGRWAWWPRRGPGGRPASEISSAAQESEPQVFEARAESPE